MEVELTQKPSKSFQELIVWQKAHQLVLAIYRLSEEFPKHELYGLVSQLRRAAVSIPANIAEGYKKRGIAGKLRFLNIAEGSLEEVRYYLILSADLRYGETDNCCINWKKQAVCWMVTAKVFDHHMVCCVNQARYTRLPPRFLWTLLLTPCS